MDYNITSESAYNTPFSNSPLLPLLLMTLATQRNAPKQATTFKDEYDYIVVGAGSAGSVVANRLSELPCASILLLEAGHAAPLLNDIPAICNSFIFSDMDWDYKTVPLKNTGESLVNRQLLFPAGKGLGGSSLLNAMLYVRGNRKNYDDWAAQGAEGWSYEEVLPYFLKMEDNKNIEYLENGYHSTGGPLTVMKPRCTPEVKAPLEEAAKELGYEIVDSNGPIQTGFDELQGTLRNSQRCSNAKAYLVPAENRTNLDIIGDAHVKRILFEGTRAVGVEFDYKKMTHAVRAKREVILSAGTINSAQLLMLSGIGPKEHLEQFNIPVIADLPVGNNLQDQCAAIMCFTTSSKPIQERLQDNQTIEKYINDRSGPLASPSSTPILAFLNKQGPKPDIDFPDYELLFTEIGVGHLEGHGLTDEAYNAVFQPYENDSVLACLSQQMHPKSRGTVRLQSSDPYDPPIIDPNYFDVPSDLDNIVAGLKKCRDIGLSEAMKQVNASEFKTVYPNCKAYEKNTDKSLECMVRNSVITLSHQVGTCKMGDPNDDTTVVDPLLKVKGLQGLRVVDGSIMPIITTGNVAVPAIMIGEKGSDIIKRTIECSPNQCNYQ